jgi:tRNA G18 (ribose-2'-O)-methylase SpoU
MKPRLKSSPDLSLNSPLHQKAIEAGEDRFDLWERNVIDEFKGLSNEEIRTRLAATAFPFAVLLEGWLGDLNLGVAVRNANAFNAREVFYLGMKRVDRRSMLGVQHYTSVHWLPTLDDALKLKEQYHWVGFDNLPGAKPLMQYQWHKEKSTLMLFGAEDCGLTPGLQELCDEIVAIEQYGSVRSLNAGSASGIAMYSFVADQTKKHSSA